MRMYKEELKKRGLTNYRAAKELGCTRQYLGDVLNGAVGAGKSFEERWVKVYGKLPEDDGVKKIRSASPKVVVKPAVVPEFEDIMKELSDGVSNRIKNAFEGKPMPKSTEELVSLLTGSWATGVKDAVKFFASANAEDKE